jgi:hypothetical protein
VFVVDRPPLVAAEYSLPEIRAAVEQYANSIETLQGRQRVIFRWEGPIDRSPGAVLVMEDLTVDTDFKVDLVHGRTSLLDSRTWYYRDISAEPFALEQPTSFDGETSYHLARTVSRSPLLSKMPLNAPFRLIIGPKDGTEVHHRVWRLAGLPCAGPQVSLAAILSAADARITGGRTIDQHECAEITATSGAFRIEASLDPDASWLPRRYSVYYQSSTASPSEPEIPDIEEFVTEFKQFPVDASDKSIWFPVRGRHKAHKGATVVDLELNDLRINVPLAKAEFQIDPATLPPGVRVETPTGLTYTGGREDLWKELDAQIDEETNEMDAIIAKSRGAAPKSESAAPVRVERKSVGTWTAIVMGLVSLATVIAGIRLAWKRS